MSRSDLFQILQAMRPLVSTRELVLASQTAFWHATSDSQKIVLVHFMSCLMKDLPAEKRPMFVKQIVPSLGSLITPMDTDGLDESKEEEDGDMEMDDSEKKTREDLDMKISNNSPEGIEEKEEAIRRARDKLLGTFLPVILEFFEALIDGTLIPGNNSHLLGPPSKELSNATLRPLIDFLPHLVPNMRRFQGQAERVMSLVRILGSVYPLDLLKYFKTKEEEAAKNSCTPFMWNME